jgi:hypothetical protein
MFARIRSYRLSELLTCATSASWSPEVEAVCASCTAAWTSTPKVSSDMGASALRPTSIRRVTSFNRSAANVKWSSASPRAPGESVKRACSIAIFTG